jgi:hypothetical protein
MDRLPTRGRHNRIARVAAVDLAGDAVRCGDPLYPSCRCLQALNGRRSLHTILVTARIGTARIAPGTSHVQGQKISARITATGLMVKRRATSIGVTGSPLIRCAPKFNPTGSSAHQVMPSDTTLAIRKMTMPNAAPTIGASFNTSARTPHSSGFARPQAHMTPSVHNPTVALIGV